MYLMKSISKPGIKASAGNGFLDLSYLPAPLSPPLSIPPQLMAQKHKSSKSRIWHIEALAHVVPAPSHGAPGSGAPGG